MRSALSLAAMALAGCLDAGITRCPSGLICPDAQVCAPSGDRCVYPEQIAACADVPDGDGCELDGSDGACHGGACLPVACGNDRVDPGEACDRGDVVPGDG